MSDRQLAFQSLDALTLNGKPARLTDRAFTYHRRELVAKDGTDRTVLSANQLNDLMSRRAGQWWTKDQMWRVG